MTACGERYPLVKYAHHYKPPPDAPHNPPPGPSAASAIPRSKDTAFVPRGPCSPGLSWLAGSACYQPRAWSLDRVWSGPTRGSGFHMTVASCPTCGTGVRRGTRWSGRTIPSPGTLPTERTGLSVGSGWTPRPPRRSRVDCHLGLSKMGPSGPRGLVARRRANASPCFYVGVGLSC
jgi:hypothetical protein